MIETSTPAPGAGRPGLANAVAAEWTKLRSVRSTYWLLVVGAVVIVGLAVLITVGLGTGNVTSTNDTFDAAGISLLGAWFGQIAFGVLGVLTVTSEYATGTIRTTLAAVPRRGMLIAAKLVVGGGRSLVGRHRCQPDRLPRRAGGSRRPAPVGGTRRRGLATGRPQHRRLPGRDGTARCGRGRTPTADRRAVLTVLGLGLAPTLFGGLPDLAAGPTC